MKKYINNLLLAVIVGLPSAQLFAQLHHHDDDYREERREDYEEWLEDRHEDYEDRREARWEHITYRRRQVRRRPHDRRVYYAYGNRGVKKRHSHKRYWAKAHRYHFKHHVYFPEYRMFYDPYREVYVYWKANRWHYSNVVPRIVAHVDLRNVRTHIMVNLPLSSQPEYHYRRYARNHHSNGHIHFGINISL